MNTSYIYTIPLKTWFLLHYTIMDQGMCFAANIFESCEASAQDAAQNIDKKIEEIGVKIQKTEEEAFRTV